MIHNHYPSIAEEIRVKLGASSRERRDAARDELKLEREKTNKLRKELAEATSQIAKLASINETLLLENQVLRATAALRTCDDWTHKIASRRANAAHLGCNQDSDFFRTLSVVPAVPNVAERPIVLKNSGLVLTGNESSVTQLSRTATMARSSIGWAVDIHKICSKKLPGDFFNTIDP